MTLSISRKPVISLGDDPTDGLCCPLLADVNQVLAEEVWPAGDWFRKTTHCLSRPNN